MGENRLMADLYAENERLKARISELESKHFVECTIISQYDDELKEAKRLLKAAVPIINNTFPETGSCWGCANHDEAKDECKGGAFEECSEVCKWEHADEALALIGEDTNVPASADDTNVGHKSGGWISCKDYMPDTLERALSTMYSDCCLVCDAFGWVGMAYYITDGQKSWWEFADAQNKNKIDWTEVTHWQPLPKPPKDGDTNE